MRMPTKEELDYHALVFSGVSPGDFRTRLFNSPEHNSLAERIAATRFMDIARLAQRAKGSTLGFDFNRRFQGDRVKETYGGIKRAFAQWVVGNIDNDKLSEHLPEFEQAAKDWAAKKGRKSEAKPNTYREAPIENVPVPGRNKTDEEKSRKNARDDAMAEQGQSLAASADLSQVITGILETAKAQADSLDDARQKIWRGVFAAEFKALQNKIDRLTAARPIILTVQSSEGTHTVTMGPQHHMFTRLLKLCAVRKSNGDALNLWVTGPAGSGKTTAAANCAKALQLPFHFTGAVKDEFKLLGFTDAHGRTVRTAFREAYEHGGIFLFDEIDGCDAGALLAFNAALANGECDFPDMCVKRHANCIIIAAANTWGSGPTAKYMGRAKLDAASLNRFVMLPWEYDETLELATSGNADWARKVQAMRKRVTDLGIDHVVSPRATYDGAALLANGFSEADTAAMCIRAGLSDAQWAQVTRGIL